MRISDWSSDVCSSDLAAAAAGGRDGEAHLVVDIHEGHRPGGVGAGAGDERAARAQGGELVADAAAGLEREPGLVDLFQDAVHRVGDGARDGAVDRAGGRLVRSEEHTSELQSLMRISYAVFCMTNKQTK